MLPSNISSANRAIPTTMVDGARQLKVLGEMNNAGDVTSLNEQVYAPRRIPFSACNLFSKLSPSIITVFPPCDDPPKGLKDKT